MMAAASNNSDRNGGVAMGMGWAERIASNLTKNLLIVSVPLFLFGIHYWRTCMVSVCVTSH